MTATTRTPNDEDAERALLGHTLHHGRIPEGVNGLAPSDFYRPEHEIIWAAMAELADHCDLPSVLNYLEKRGRLKRGTLKTRNGVGDLYLAELMEAPPIVDPGHMASIIHEHSQRRKVIELGRRVLQQAQDPTSDLDELLRRSEEELGRVREGDPDEPEQSSWRPIDLTPVLRGDWQPPYPTVGRRSDGKGLLYSGRTHTGVGETEAGKGWFALSASVDEMKDGNHVVYVDFEDDEGTVVGRLLTLGVRRDLIGQRFHYIRPEDPLEGRHLEELTAALHDYKPTLALLDGITEGMRLHGFNPLDNMDISLFNAHVVKHFIITGAAQLSLDHVVKDRDGRGKYALGGVHKLNIVTGASYILENRHPFGIGIKGVSTIKIAKDRPGQLRVNALPSASLHWYGDLVLTSKDQDFAEVCIYPPIEREESSQSAEPAAYMTRIAEALAKHGPMKSQNMIETAVEGRAVLIRDALNRLILDGYVSESRPYGLIKPYPPEDETA